MNIVYLLVVIEKPKARWPALFGVLPSFSWRRGQERGVGTWYFPCWKLQRAYCTTWTGRDSLHMRGTVKSTLAVEDITMCSQQTSSHKNKTVEPSRHSSESMPAVANFYMLCTYAVYFKQTHFRLMYPGIYGSFFRNVVFTKAESWPPKALEVHKIENFFDSDFGICVISLLVMHK